MFSDVSYGKRMLKEGDHSCISEYSPIPAGSYAGAWSDVLMFTVIPEQSQRPQQREQLKTESDRGL
jgi:hypothetical protein